MVHPEERQRLQEGPPHFVGHRRRTRRQFRLQEYKVTETGVAQQGHVVVIDVLRGYRQFLEVDKDHRVKEGKVILAAVDDL